MLVSYKWLNSFFDGNLPSPEEVVEALTFHAWEIEGTEEKDGDTIIEVNVLPDTAPWALSHRGVAKNLSVVLNLPLAHDPLRDEVKLEPKSDDINIELRDGACDRYGAARIDGVKVGPSPEWLSSHLKAIGQKPINNVVDAANFVMFHTGQPLHAFDADKLGGEAADHIVVRKAGEGEKITVLTGEEYELTGDDLLIVDGTNDKAVGIAGIKGGKAAEVGTGTTNILIEAAHFDHVTVRKTSQRLRLRTDASSRFENGIVPDMAAYGLVGVVKLIAEIAGGTLKGFADVYPAPRAVEPVRVSLEKINSVLGVKLTVQEVAGILDRFQYVYKMNGTEFVVTPPIERPDLVIKEDFIEEIGRVYGYKHVPSVTPEQLPLKEINKRFYYSERISEVLVERGFSEVFTSSFRNKDVVHLANALASDKEYLRSTLRENQDEALEKNRMNADLLGVTQIRMFEIGTVFLEDAEHTSLVLGVRSASGYKPKQDDSVLAEAVEAIQDIIKSAVQFEVKNGIAEINLDAALEALPNPEAYEPHSEPETITYQAFSPYPFVTRDIAMWTEDTSEAELRELIRNHAGALLVRDTLFDRFEKEGRVSYAFRLVFQSFDKTLTDEEVNEIMDSITGAVEDSGCEVR